MDHRQIPTKDDLETGDYINHSCDPNCGMKNAVCVVTMRDIAVGEAITFDYAMVNIGYRYIQAESFACNCGADTCRGTISAADYNMVGYRYLDFLSRFAREMYLSQHTGKVPVSFDSSRFSITDENSFDNVG